MLSLLKLLLVAIFGNVLQKLSFLFERSSRWLFSAIHAFAIFESTWVYVYFFLTFNLYRFQYLFYGVIVLH